MINLALIGFSRGAATARAFALRVAADCREKAGSLSLGKLDPSSRELTIVERYTSVNA
jgi:hypothetical protein